MNLVKVAAEVGVEHSGTEGKDTAVLVTVEQQVDDLSSTYIGRYKMAEMLSESEPEPSQEQKTEFLVLATCDLISEMGSAFNVEDAIAQLDDDTLDSFYFSEELMRTRLEVLSIPVFLASQVRELLDVIRCVVLKQQDNAAGAASSSHCRAA